MIDAVKLLKKIKKDRRSQKIKAPEIGRIKWVAGCKRYYFTSITATNGVAKDNYQFTTTCLNNLVRKYKFTSVICCIDFKWEQPIGSSRFSGIINPKNQLYQLITNNTIIVLPETGNILSGMSTTLGIKLLKSHKRKEITVIDDCSIQCVSFIEKKYSVDKHCVVLEILKDSDIDKRLEE